MPWWASLVATVLFGCSAPIDPQVVGTWEGTFGQITYNADGSYSDVTPTRSEIGTWSADGRVLTMNWRNSTNGREYRVDPSTLALSVHTRAFDSSDAVGEWVEHSAADDIDHWRLDAGNGADVWNDFDGVHHVGKWSQTAGIVSITWTGHAIDPNEPPAQFEVDATQIDSHTMVPIGELLTRVQ